MIYYTNSAFRGVSLPHMEGEGKRKENMEKYAVLETGGKQVLVKVGQKIEIEKIAVEAGQDAELTTVLAV